MGKRKSRERGEAGLLFRNGQLVNRRHADKIDEDRRLPGYMGRRRKPRSGVEEMEQYKEDHPVPAEDNPNATADSTDMLFSNMSAAEVDKVIEASVKQNREGIILLEKKPSDIPEDNELEVIDD